MQDDLLFRDATGILKVMALGAHKVCSSHNRTSTILTSIDPSTHPVTQTGSTSFLNTQNNTQAMFATSPQTWTSSLPHLPHRPYSHTSHW